MNPKTDPLKETILSLTGSSKATPTMQASVLSMYENVLCPLCNHILDKPMALSCGHTFCNECIVKFADNKDGKDIEDRDHCPEKNCFNMFTLDGSKKFTRNPNVDSLVESITNIVQTLALAKPAWWAESHDENDDKDKDGNDKNDEHAPVANIHHI